jgi:nucleoside-diphosphate-sugar epimerase
MRVVITGATGNVGTSLVERLEAEPAVDSIVGIARRPPRWHLDKTTWVGADVSRDPLHEHLRGADAVVHLAWIFQPTQDPVMTWENNVGGSLRVFTAAADEGVPTIVHASSVGAYSARAKRPPVDERWRTHALPTAAYGREKSYIERVLDTFEREHPATRVVRMRPGFIFKRESAASQRRLFAGPLLPGPLARPAFIPVVPDLPGLEFQVLHSTDAADAYRRALLADVRGAFNLAAEPVIDASVLAEVLGARVVRMPSGPLRTAVAAAWHLHLVPASPQLVDLFLGLPLMDTTRAREELGWHAVHPSTFALDEFLAGLRQGVGGPTPALAADAGGPLRSEEFTSGIGQVDPVAASRDRQG